LTENATQLLLKTNALLNSKKLNIFLNAVPNTKTPTTSQALKLQTNLSQNPR
jgi:hypothetical protein